MLTVDRLGLPAKLRRSLACTTSSIENMVATARRVCRKREAMAKCCDGARWTAARMMQAAKGFRRLNAYKQLPILRAAFVVTLPSTSSPRTLKRTLMPHSRIDGDVCFAYLNKIWGIPVSMGQCWSEAPSAPR
jgi:hypothetical protein